jgi:putative endonuclease
MFTVYALYSENFDKIYIGFTSDIEKRLNSHNVLSKKGWTIKFRPWSLIYSEEFETKPLAMAREKELKSATGRRWIRSLIIKKR